MTSLKLLVRAARHIQRAYETHCLQPDHQTRSALNTLEEDVRVLGCTHTRLLFSRKRGWESACAQLAMELQSQAASVQEAARRIRLALEAPRPGVPSLRFVVEELRQLAEEFDNFNLDWKARRLSVTTEPIELEGVYLGPFQIRLPWNELPRGLMRYSLSIVALDPHPADASEDVTHPHVKDEILCAGDGKLPLEQALREGRLVDACMIVRSVLNTYNCDSPHVPLAAWHDRSCCECGAGLSENYVNYCEGCDGDCCDECYRDCALCDTGRCSACLGECTECGDRACVRCRRVVPGRGIICKRCIENPPATEPVPGEEAEPAPLPV